MNEMNNILKLWINSLSLLDNCYVNSTIIIILVLYSSLVFENINMYIGELYNYSIIRVIVLLLIIYISRKDLTIAILLGVSYLVSVYYSSNKESFSTEPPPRPLPPILPPSQPIDEMGKTKESFKQYNTIETFKERKNDTVNFLKTKLSKSGLNGLLSSNEYKAIVNSAEGQEFARSINNFFNSPTIRKEFQRLNADISDVIRDITNIFSDPAGQDLTNSLINLIGTAESQINAASLAAKQAKKANKSLMSKDPSETAYQFKKSYREAKEETYPEDFSNKNLDLTCGEIFPKSEFELLDRDNKCSKVGILTTEFSTSGYDNNINDYNINGHNVSSSYNVDYFAEMVEDEK